ncbi:MAG TPA: peptidase S10, partial [Rhodanobacter sp.]
MRKSLQTVLLAALLLAVANTSALAADAPKKPATEDVANSHGFHLPPFPADAHTTQTSTADGKTLKYTVTVGSLPVRDEKGDITGEVVFTAYTMAGKDRPVTFALNGGPGASSVYL